MEKQIVFYSLENHYRYNDKKKLLGIVPGTSTSQGSKLPTWLPLKTSALLTVYVCKSKNKTMCNKETVDC
jgi:hypothetical protein